MIRLRIELLGLFQVWLDDELLHFAYNKQRALLAYLAMTAGEPVAREKLGLLLWPDCPQATMQNNLRQVLLRLRQLLDDSDRETPWLAASQNAVQLNTHGELWIDAAAFQGLIADCSGHRHRHAQSCPACYHVYRQACGLYRGDFLDGLSLPDSDTFESWATFWRESLHLQALTAHQAVAEYQLQRGNHAEALAAAMRLVALDGLHEDGNRLVVAALAGQGQFSQALAHYEYFRHLLQREVGAEPSAATQRLVQSIRSGGWHTDTPASPGQGGQAVILYQTASLVGRDVETSELNARLNDPSCRLITITGLGGVGKTHLAAAVAQEQARVFRDGVVYLPLAGVAAPELVLPAIAQALGCQSLPQQALLQQLANRLRDKDLLLVLDHCEQLLEARHALGELLERCPGLVLLLTSQQRLHLPGEWVFVLGGLQVPPSAKEVTSGTYSAANLFVQVARQARGDFALDEPACAAIADICRLVGGLPLAIVLLASWVRVLPCAAIAAELRRSIDMIRTAYTEEGDAAVSIRAVLEQSWQSLAGEDRRVLAALSVFSGGFDWQAAQKVAGASIDVLSRLVDHSLVQVSQEGRYDCHELVRQFAAEKLAAAGHAEELAGRHFRYYLQQSEANGREIEGFANLAAYLWFAREYANLEAALLWANTHKAQVDGAAPERLADLIMLVGHRSGTHQTR